MCDELFFFCLIFPLYVGYHGCAYFPFFPVWIRLRGSFTGARSKLGVLSVFPIIIIFLFLVSKIDISDTGVLWEAIFFLFFSHSLFSPFSKFS